MGDRDWERRLPEGVHVQSRDRAGFRLGVAMPVSQDGLWPMRCPEHPDEHFFKIEVTQKPTDEQADPEKEDSPLYCPYCGHAADLWDFAPEQHARAMTAATAAAEQYIVSELDAMLRKAFGGRSPSSPRKSGISIEFKPGRPPRRRSLPELGEVEETRRTMACERCSETFAVYGLAFYCPECGQLAPAQQVAELIRVHRERLDAIDGLPQTQKQVLADAGVLNANYESTIKDGFSALETYLKARFTANAPRVPLKGKGAVFQRLDEAATLYFDHLGVDLPALVALDGWQEMLRVAAIRHVLVHNSGVVDDQFLARLPDWPQRAGQRIHVRRDTAIGFLDLLSQLSAALR